MSLLLNLSSRRSLFHVLPAVAAVHSPPSLFIPIRSKMTEAKPDKKRMYFALPLHLVHWWIVLTFYTRGE